MDLSKLSESSMHWNQMNCPLNTSLNQVESSFYISQKAPPDFILPPGITCKIYHPLHMDGSKGEPISQDSKNAIMKFIREHDRTDSGNTTELSQESFARLTSTATVIAVLYKEGDLGTSNEIIGTMFSIIFRAQTSGNCDLITSYTTFLCVANEFRDAGLAMALIRAIMKEGYIRYGIMHGYYMTADHHHRIHSKIDSWYRPINVQKASDAGFTLESFSRSNDRGSIVNRQKIAYHISNPSLLPTKVTSDSYGKVLRILKKGDFYLNPTPVEFSALCKCFDIYTVGNDSLFMLFPMSIVIGSTGKKIRNAQVPLMIGNVLPQALWVAAENKYDMLYGWCGGDITPERVSGIRGLITTATSFVELYNTQTMIPINKFMVPLF